MIIKGREGTGGPALANYLEGGKNEHAEVLEYRNMDAASLCQAIYMMDMFAKPGDCEKHALHVQMRAAPGERLSADTWRDAVDRYAEAFGMQEHHAAVVLHRQPDGCTHCHVVFNRVHPETLKPADLWRNQFKHKALARQMELDYGLQIVTDHKRDKPRDYSNAGMKEQQQAHRGGESVHEIRDRIKSAWEQSDNGQSFSAALEAEGFTLAQGDRRDFVAVDDYGNPYSIGKRTTGASPADIRAKLADLDPDNVPSVQAVKLGLELAAEEELKNEKERKGKGEASAAPAPVWNKAQQDNDRPRTFYADRQAERAARWEAAAAARVNRLLEKFARDYEKQQRDFDKAANLETGAAVHEFNDLKRHDQTAALLKRQAEELALELRSQQQKREAFAAVQSERDFNREQRRAEHAERERDFKQSQINKKLKLQDVNNEDEQAEAIDRRLKALLMKGINQANLEHKRALNRQSQGALTPENKQGNGTGNQQGHGQATQTNGKTTSAKDSPAAPDPWMKKAGGFDQLSDEHKQAARQSYETWTSTGDEKQQAKRKEFAFQDYVNYVQKKEMDKDQGKPREESKEAEERAQNQAARERQEAARQEPVPKDDKAARIAEHLRKYHEAQEANQNQKTGGRKLRPDLGRPKL